MGAKPKSQPIQAAVLSATPRAVNQTGGTATTQRKRKAFGIDDTFMRAFAEEASKGSQTLGA